MVMQDVGRRARDKIAGASSHCDNLGFVHDVHIGLGNNIALCVMLVRYSNGADRESSRCKNCGTHIERMLRMRVV